MVSQSRSSEDFVVRRSVKEDVPGFANCLREIDIEECRLFTGQDAFQSLNDCFLNVYENHCYSAFYRGKPVCMFGISTSTAGAPILSPWLLGTEEIDRHPIPFMRATYSIFPRFLTPVEKGFSLRNVIMEKNQSTIRWLTRLGFAFSDPFEYLGHQVRVFSLGK